MTLNPRNDSCVILVPVSNSIVPRCEAGLRELESRGYAVRRTYGYAAIDQGRNQMATDALMDGYDETMWIDSDIVFNPDSVDRLRAMDAAISCGIYPKKAQRELAIHVMPGAEELQFGKNGDIVEVKYAAGGFLHVRRKVYETIQSQLRLPTCNQQFASPMIPFFQPLVVDQESAPWYLAEDFAFSERARQCGFQILADTQIRLFHVGDYGYSWEDAGGAVERFDSYRFRLK